MDDATLLEALTLSGPAGGAVVVLGWLVRGWLSSIRVELGVLAGDIKAVRSELAQLERGIISDLRERVAGLQERSERIAP